jgi:hypothetical protein
MHEYMLGRAEDYADAPKVAAINPLSLITAAMLAEDLASPTFDSLIRALLSGVANRSRCWLWLCPSLWTSPLAQRLLSSRAHQ